jgi:predicted DNA-binding transcriptional regulator AlpA
MRRSPTASLTPAVMNYAACADYIGLPTANALAQMVSRGNGPPWFRFGKRDVRFMLSAVDAWLAGKAGPPPVSPAAPPPVKRGRGRPTKAEQIARRPR